MKLVFAALLTITGLSLATPSVAVATPIQLLESCQAVLNAVGTTQSATVTIPVAGLTCWHYMAAVQNMSVIVDQHGRHLLGVCAPPETSRMQYVRIFARYALRHPMKATDNAAALALRALVEAFPCSAHRNLL